MRCRPGSGTFGSAAGHVDQVALKDELGRAEPGETGPVAVFLDRVDAGRHLAAVMRHLGADEPLVLGVPRGGVVVAAEVSRALGAPLDVLVVGKLSVPGQPDLVMGAIGEDQVTVINDNVVRLGGVSSKNSRRWSRVPGRSWGSGRADCVPPGRA
jgi:hypothetical protein